MSGLGKRVALSVFWSILIAIVCLMALEQVQAVKVGDTLAKDEYGYYDLILDPEFGYKNGTTINFNVEFKDGYAGDYYLMLREEYTKFDEGESFTAILTYERSTTIETQWLVPDRAIYYLVIDNSDNANPDDAGPAGELTFEGTITGSTPPSEDDIMGYLICLGTIGLVVIVVGVAFFKLGIVDMLPFGSGYQPKGGSTVRQQSTGPSRYVPPPAPGVGESEGSKLLTARECDHVAIPPPDELDNVPKKKIECPGCGYRFMVDHIPGTMTVFCPKCHKSGEMEL